jgi:hypothetical protein
LVFAIRYRPICWAWIEVMWLFRVPRIICQDLTVICCALTLDCRDICKKKCWDFTVIFRDFAVGKLKYNQDTQLICFEICKNNSFKISLDIIKRSQPIINTSFQDHYIFFAISRHITTRSWHITAIPWHITARSRNITVKSQHFFLQISRQSNVRAQHITVRSWHMILEQ